VIRSAFGGFVDEVSSEPRVVAVGLIGSWARGDASDASDFDLMVVERSGLGYEFDEAVEWEGLSLDVNRVPWSWVGAPVSPVVDHRLHEVVVLRDPDGVLDWAMGFVGRNYRAPGRIEVRSDGYLAAAEMYLSRASSAASRGDLETASLFAGVCWVPVAHVLMDIAGLPVTRRDLVWGLHRACGRLGAGEVYDWFVSGSGVSGLDAAWVREGVGLFEGVWGGVSEFVGGEGEAVGRLHDQLRREIEYLTDGLVLRGILGRVGEMLGMNHYVGAAMYMRGWLLPLLEGYAWVLSSGVGEKYDYTSLFRTMGEHGSADILEGALAVFGLGDVREGLVLGEIDGARRVVGDVRLDRRRLIEGFV
jgi:hypothetical protein